MTGTPFDRWRFASPAGLGIALTCLLASTSGYGCSDSHGPGPHGASDGSSDDGLPAGTGSCFSDPVHVPVPVSGCEEVVFEPRDDVRSPCISSAAAMAGAASIGIHFADPSQFGEVSAHMECVDSWGRSCYGHVDVLKGDTCSLCESWSDGPATFGTRTFSPRDVDAENGERTGADYLLAGYSVRFVFRVCPP